MKRIILMVLRNILFVPYWAIQLCLYGKEKDQHTELEKYGLLRKITRSANKGGRVKIWSRGNDCIPEKDGFILFPNHQGLFDVLALIESCGRPFSVIMKKEVKNVPLLKQVFAIMKAQPIDRGDVKQALKVITTVAQEVSEGRNYVIFPEGTRSRHQNEVQEFKGGSFKAAFKSKCPIVPVALIDSFKPFDTKSIKKTTVQVHYLKPLYYNDYKEMKSTEIAKFVREEIQKVIREHEKDLYINR